MPLSDHQKRTVYMFLDEGGNFDFTPNGTRFFLLTCVTMERPFLINMPLGAYLYECIEYGLPQEYFHCAEDNSYVRKRVFRIIGDHIHMLHVDSLIVEKCKVAPTFQDPKHFYAKMLGYLLRYVMKGQDPNSLYEVIVITDILPINRQRRAVEKSVKQTLAEMLPINTQYRLLHHASRAHFGLQVVDYCNWAILRKWERGGHEHYDTIKFAIKSEYDIFKNSSKKYY